MVIPRCFFLKIFFFLVCCFYVLSMGVLIKKTKNCAWKRRFSKPPFNYMKVMPKLSLLDLGTQVSVFDSLIRNSLSRWLSVMHCFFGSLIHWVPDSLTHWFVHSLIHWFIGWLIHWRILWLIASIKWLIDSLIHWLNETLNSFYIGAFVHSFVDWLAHRFIGSFSQLCMASSMSFNYISLASQPLFAHSSQRQHFLASASQKLSYRRLIYCN